MKIRNKLLALFIIISAFMAFGLIANEDAGNEEKQAPASADEEYYETPEAFPEDGQVKSFDFRYSPYDRDNTDVNGLKLGIPMSAGLGTVDGAEISLISSDTANIKGFQGAMLVNMTNYINGLQMGVANMIREEGNCGQVGFLAFTAKKVNGAQISLFNYSRITEGVQIGIINDAEDIATWQIGIFCYNKEAWIPFLLGINFDPALFESSYDDEDESASDPEGQTPKEAESEITPDTTSDTAMAEAKQVPWYNILGW